MCARYELAAFVVAGVFAGIAGALFGIFNRGVFPDFVYWPKSAEVLIMTILGGMGQFWGPVVGAATLIVLNQQITSYTEYWPIVLGTILIVLLFAFPGGIRRRACGARPARRRRAAGRDGEPRCLRSTASQVLRRFPASRTSSFCRRAGRSPRSSARTAPANRRCST